MVRNSGMATVMFGTRAGEARLHLAMGHGVKGLCGLALRGQAASACHAAGWHQALQLRQQGRVLLPIQCGELLCSAVMRARAGGADMLVRG
ncbi:hypothetical protein AT984_20090 [Paucibacter sp. KCTC 42545]|nr:hypothetical protein AT984_20090 [Paucibacter sp. KCTC 42545]